MKGWRWPSRALPRARPRALPGSGGAAFRRARPRQEGRGGADRAPRAGVDLHHASARNRAGGRGDRTRRGDHRDLLLRIPPRVRARRTRPPASGEGRVRGGEGARQRRTAACSSSSMRPSSATSAPPPRVALRRSQGAERAERLRVEVPRRRSRRSPRRARSPRHRHGSARKRDADRSGTWVLDLRRPALRRGRARRKPPLRIRETPVARVEAHDFGHRQPFIVEPARERERRRRAPQHLLGGTRRRPTSARAPSPARGRRAVVAQLDGDGVRLAQRPHGIGFAEPGERRAELRQHLCPLRRLVGSSATARRSNDAAAAMSSRSSAASPRDGDAQPPSPQARRRPGRSLPSPAVRAPPAPGGTPPRRHRRRRARPSVPPTAGAVRPRHFGMLRRRRRE